MSLRLTFHSARVFGVHVATLLLLALGAPAGLEAQLDPDSIPAPPDSLVAADSAAVIPAEVSADTTDASTVSLADSLQRPIRRLPGLPGDRVPEAAHGPDTWEWDREALLGRPNFTLIELLAEVPGTVPLRFGDYGTPEGLVWEGMAGGRVRVFFDGIEELGLAGSQPDLSRIPLVGLERVTVRRIGGEVRIELEALQASDARPLSMIEAGTGDLDTNLFRGTFIQGDALGGALGVGIERLDTQGTGGQESGARQGLWLRYLRPVGERLSVAAEIRSGFTDQTVEQGPAAVTRSSSMLRARWTHSDALAAEAFYASSSLSEDVDSLPSLDESATQYGLRVGWSPGEVWARGELRIFDGDLPSRRLDLDVGGMRDGVGSASLRLGSDAFHGESATIWGVSAETAPVAGLRAFGAVSGGDRGWRGLADTTTAVAPDSLSDPVSLYELPIGQTSRDEVRLGLQFQGYGADLTAAWLSTSTDSIRPVATFLDGGGTAFAGDEATGWEARLRYDIPLLEGLFVDGSWQQWDAPGIYRPEEIYRGGIGFHRIYYDTGNFEFWAGLMAEGRSAMQLPFVDAAAQDEFEGEGDPPVVPMTVPFYQSWNGYLQIRVVTVRIFIRFENAFVRSMNQDFPGRLLPATRAMYGVRWTLWN